MADLQLYEEVLLLSLRDDKGTPVNCTVGRDERNDTMTTRELGKGETHLAHAAIVELRPGQADLAAFVRRFDEVQRPEGCRLYAAFDLELDSDQAVGAAVFRAVHNLAWGDALYVDDLSVRPFARRRGHAAALLAAIEQEARRLGCRAVHLDSGHQRHDAHRVYLANGYRMTSHHFAYDLD